MNSRPCVGDMAERPLVLLVLFEGLPSTVVDSAVLDHARQLASVDIARFEIWAFCPTITIYRNSRNRLEAAKRLAGCPVRLFRAVRPAMPGSVTINAHLLRSALRRLDPPPDLIHARGDYTSAVCALAKDTFRIPILWDCRGNSVAEAEERLGRHAIPRSLKKYKLRREAYIRQEAAAACDGALFVSNPLRAVCGNLLEDKPTAVIPCAASEDIFFFDECLRACSRERLGYAADHRVFVFSGGMQPYQCVDLTVETFRKLAAKDPAARLLIITPNAPDAIQAVQFHNQGFIRVIEAAYHEVNRYLNAADAGFLLREQSSLNEVASPTKFAEYCLTGLPVIMQNTVKDAFEMARSLGNLIELTDLGVHLPTTGFDRTSVANKARMLMGRRALSNRYRMIHTKLLKRISRVP
jgi:glycosyltransferase involved in cell wall biosynthesis